MCRRRALRALDGLGDPTLGEWQEWTGAAYHIRRRLTPTEQTQVGPAVDIRGTPEARQRVAAIGPLLGYAPPEIVASETEGPT